MLQSHVSTVALNGQAKLGMLLFVFFVNCQAGCSFIYARITVVLHLAAMSYTVFVTLFQKCFPYFRTSISLQLFLKLNQAYIFFYM